MKWLEARDILQAEALVCRGWGELASTEELWRSLYEDCFHSPCESPAKSAYRENYLATSTLLMIRNSTVTLISVPKLSSPNAVRTIELLQDSGIGDRNAYCLLTGFKVLRFGNDESPEVQLIDLRTGAISLIAPMSCPRLYPGLIRYQGYIYLFGGHETTAEKLKLTTWTWEGIKDVMKSNKSSITAARHLTSVYLAYSTEIEVFDLETELFSVLQLQALDGWCYSLCLVVSDELVILQKEIVERWRIGSNETGFRAKQGTSRGDGYYTNCPPIWYQGVCYCLHNDYPRILGVLASDAQRCQLDEVLTFDR